ncbi:helix-turn-helix domain-containing protein [Rickettsiales endosymbiont of Stachyamoeba lipophora]|uniref:helix-turn-helix domain-containing protein n=1 Tax=Rickettsiales endosymbiont of Stachyamoeba lipophora TaxID=2486578 RepID=UPI000F64CE70|nr:helix-turn-helix domain-containing protein [Rickettsiales endosymbiont of Stachyamoeba lipophora]AZL15274.1 DNA-binding protein [Rickettsiales endosymbiont of Stachyamoeba lipophora]
MIPKQKHNILLPTPEAAELIGVKPNMLEIWRAKEVVRIPYIKIGRLVKYRLSDLEKFLDDNSQFIVENNEA